MLPASDRFAGVAPQSGVVDDIEEAVGEVTVTSNGNGELEIAVGKPVLLTTLL